MAKLTLYNVAIVAVVCLGAFSYGFGFAIFITSIGQPGFYVYFDLDPNSAYTASILGAVNALFAAGAGFGSIAQGWTADWLGRKGALVLAAICATIGGALTAGSVNVPMMVVVRLLQGFGLGMIICLVPLYITEVAPAHRRGLLSGLTVLGFGFGYMFNAWISLGAYHAANVTLQWRLPLALACVGPLLLLIGLPFIPESPRYLAWTNKTDEAWKVIQTLHQDPNDPSDAAAQAEFIQITRQVAHDKEQKAGYIQMFIKPSWRRRSFLVMFLLFASQSTGILGITNFIITIFQGLGVSGDVPFILLGLYVIVGCIAVVGAIFLVDIVGRRRLILIGYPLIALVLIAEAVLQWKYVGTDSKPGNAACLVFIFIYIICYQFVDAPSFVWAAEIFPTTIRAKGLGLTFFAYFMGAITYTTPSGLAFQTIKWGMYLLWAGLCLISAIVVYFFIPETARLPIEEIGALFGDEVVVHLTADGQGIVEDKLDVEVSHVEKAEIVHAEAMNV